MDFSGAQAPLELWGGIECTHNRVADTYLCQLVRSGHDGRDTDLDAIAGLGIKTLRYPLLWERTAPHGPGSADWGWVDARMDHLRALGVAPIAGLVHHGSGPAHTDLLDPAFPALLAQYAGAVAARYPWIGHYTPVNEPLTTARFSCLYGHWYPHRRDDAAFVRALLHQCRATQLAMREIRRFNPAARLIATDDLALTLSTPRLQYQADFENERRWLSFDLLCGRVDRHHRLHGYLLRNGADPELLAALRDEPAPDVLGLNHYITSVRFLDDRVEHYPRERIGGNGRHTYADVEAVRVGLGGLAAMSGLAGMSGMAGMAGEPHALISAAWSRFGLPLAITEAHIGAAPEEQIRWLAEMWGAALQARSRGAKVAAVTAWSLLGAYDWHCLVTRPDGCYEAGAFEVRDGAARPTALAAFIAGLVRGDSSHPTLAERGWWRRPERLLYPGPPPARTRTTIDGLRLAGRVTE